MDVKSVNTSPVGAYAPAGAVNTKANKEHDSVQEEAAPSADGGAAVYEPSHKVYKPNAELVEQMKAESEQRMASLVQMMMGQQVKSSNIWEQLRTGNFTVDAQTKAQAQKDIADDGYWGVEQTSDRIVKYATALTGGDPDKLDTMISAFEKGYAAAEKQWGGKLPELAQKTRDAVLKKFQDIKDQNNRSPAAEAVK